MANKYWAATGAPANSQTANWSANADGSGTLALPVAGDDLVIGLDTTLNNDKGSAAINWNSPAYFDSVITFSSYAYSTKVVSTSIAFTATNTIQFSDTTRWADLGYKVGMYITISGSAAAGNNSTATIATVSGDAITVTGLTITTSGAGSSVTVESSSYIDLASDMKTKVLTLDCTLKNTSGSNKTILLDGPTPANSRYVLNGDSATILNQSDITYEYNGNGGSNPGATINFDDGPYPKLLITPAMDLTSDYVIAANSSYGKVSIYSLNVASTSSTWTTIGGSNKTLNITKVFELLTTSTLSFKPTLWNAGEATWGFKVDSSFELPVSGSTTYGAADGSFEAAFYNLTLISPDIAGTKSTIGAGRTLNVNSLIVEAGASLEGYSTVGSGHTSVITSVKRPVIQGAWNFSQVADGIYSSVLSDTYPITPSDGPVGRVQLSDDAGKFTSDAKLTWTSATSTLLVNGKLDVTGLIDPTGMQFDRQASNPGTADTVWVSNAGALMFGASAVGGGSGTVTSVAVTGSDGIEVDSGSPITTSGTVALGVNKTNMLSHLNVEDGADVTDATNVTAAGALMDSELTDLAGVKGVTISTLQPKPSEGAFANGDKTKLDGIAAGATAYTDADAIAAVEGESTLALQSGVTVGTRLKLQGFSSSDHVQIENVTQDGDVIFTVNDGGVVTEAMRIEGSSGFIGIGDTNPDAPLHINGSTNGTILKIETTSSDSMSPDMEFYSGRAPVAGDNQGNIEFNGRNETTVGANNGTAYQYARIYGGIDAASGSTVDGTEAGKLGLQIQHQGANKTMLFMEGHPTGGGMVIVNYNGVDMDFRINGEDTSNLFYVNGGSGYEGVAVGGITVPKSMFTIEGTLTLKEQANAGGDSTAYGQLWVKTATPNELYFTTDAGNDIQLTSGTSIAGGGGGSGDVVGPSSATNNNFVAFDGTTGKLVKDSGSAAATFASAAQGALANTALQPGQAGADPYAPANPAIWVGAPPPDLLTAIQRLAQQLFALGGPIP